MAALLATACLLSSGVAWSAPSDPVAWPSQPGTDPELSAGPNSIRFSGADRYQTNEALGLALRGVGDYPFDTSDRNLGGQPARWWGAGSCPRSIIVVAGDTPADALAAASLSDPTDRADQPRLVRVAAADPEFDEVGAVDRVDTGFAPVVVTTSGRSGARGLAATARATATDLVAGGCRTAREAILVGGERAVPKAVEAELVALGYEEVFRVGGTDRFDTAARIATALGTGTPPPAGTPCNDPDASDGSALLGWYGNAVAEFRFTAESCLLLPRSVVLADGLAGVDALAAGWWTSQWQVPVLLTGAGGTLPPATVAALEALDINTVIALGGRGRIPDSELERVERIVGPQAQVGRIDGDDRYETSIEMARKFGGWWPGPGAAFADDAFCAVASTADKGWPDALAAGPWCARVGASRVGTPLRALSPVQGVAARMVGGVHGVHTAVPVLLVPVGAPPTAALRQYLAAAYGALPRCSSTTAGTSCAAPGFFAIVGGGVSDEAAGILGDLVAGEASREPAPVVEGFVTRLDMRPVYRTGFNGDPRFCAGSDSIDATRWLSFSAEPSRRTFLGERDLLTDGTYQAGASIPVCTTLPALPTAVVSPVGVSGRVGAQTGLELRPEPALSLSRPIRQVGERTDGGGSVVWRFTEPSRDPVQLRRGGVSQDVIAATLGLDLRVSESGDRGVAAGSLTIRSGGVDAGATVRADARLVAGRWELAGIVRLGRFPPAGQWPDATLRGGFRATITTDEDGVHQVSWAVDGSPIE